MTKRWIFWIEPEYSLYCMMFRNAITRSQSAIYLDQFGSARSAVFYSSDAALVKYTAIDWDNQVFNRP